MLRRIACAHGHDGKRQQGGNGGEFGHVGSLTPEVWLRTLLPGVDAFYPAFGVGGDLIDDGP